MSDGSAPVLFAFGVHLHQPVGNFDSVFVQHLADVYRPLLTALREGQALPVTFHLSGPLLEWLERHAGDWLDQLGRLVADGRVELLASGFDEPILAALTPEDRLEQILRMREALRTRFGVEAGGLWLTERVWEPDLAGDLARGGVSYVVLDDRHFLAAGLERAALHLPWRTEAAGHALTVLPIDERLRYLVPFRPAAEFGEYIRDLRDRGSRLAVLADDGEKFGGWPGTKAWVYDRGWLRSWIDMLARLRDAGDLELVTCGDAVRRLPSAGLVYLPSASYREMEGWALPAPAALRLARLELELGDRIQSPEGALIRGTHWRSFLAKYPESNRMHKKMLRLSALSRARGDPPEVRRAIGRAQCNDAYWHGVFGGLYLPFLRAAIWAELARAEAGLRNGQALEAVEADVDLDGHQEIQVTSARLAAVVSPARGGGLEECTWLPSGVNLADVLTRRAEAYHQPPAPLPSSAASDDAAPSIHDIEKQLDLETLPPYDTEPRALFLERLYDAGVTTEQLAEGIPPLHSWAAAGFAQVPGGGPGSPTITLSADGLTKAYHFGADGTVELLLSWTPRADHPDAWLTTELSLSAEIELDHDAATTWSYPIETVAKSESGLVRTIQGTARVLGWPARQGHGRVRLPAGW